MCASKLLYLREGSEDLFLMSVLVVFPHTFTTMEPNNKKQSWFNGEYLKVFTRISAYIVVPVLISAFVGNYLDKRFGTAPWILGVALAFSFTFSMIAIVKIAKKYDKEVLKEKDGE